MMPMTVLVVTDACILDGGVAKVVLDSVRLLRAKGVPVVIFCGGSEIDANFKSLGVPIVTCGQYELKDVRHRYLTMIKGLWNWTIAERLKRFLSEFDPKDTAVHIHTWSKILSPAVFSVLRKSGFKTVMTCHGYNLSCPNGAQYDFQMQRVCPLKGCGLRCLVRNCDARCYAHKIWRWVRQCVVLAQLRKFPALRLVTISDREQSHLHDQIGNRHEFIRINNPMVFPFEAVVQHGERDSFVFVGRMSAEKAPQLFAEAVTRCNARGIMIGDGELLEDLRGNYPKIEFLGWRSSTEIADVLSRRAAVVVLPSVCFEGAPLVPLEAMAHGVPCIISDATNAVEYIDDGETGLLFRSGDVDDLVCKMRQLMDVARRNAIAHNVRSRFARSRYDEKTHVEKLLALYSRLLAH